MARLLESGEDVGRAAGGLTGFYYGVGAGTAVLPVVGTFVGGVLGALVGAGIGAPLGRAVSSGAKAVVRGASEESREEEDRASRSKPKSTAGT